MTPARHRTCRHLAVFLAWPLAVFWLLFAAGNFPVIVMAGEGAERETPAIAGFGLAVLSFVTALWAAGVFGTSEFQRGFGVLFLGWLLFAALPLYPMAGQLWLGWLSLAAHAAGVTAVLLGAVGLVPPDADRPA